MTLAEQTGVLCANSLPICKLISKTPKAVGPVSLIQPHRETLILKQKWDIQTSQLFIWLQFTLNSEEERKSWLRNEVSTGQYLSSCDKTGHY